MANLITYHEALLHIVQCAIKGGWNVFNRKGRDEFRWKITDNNELIVRWEMYQEVYTIETLLLNKPFITALQDYNPKVIMPSIEAVWQEHFNNKGGIKGLYLIVNQ